jgi:site-specific DNA-adenine methylase
MDMTKIYAQSQRAANKAIDGEYLIGGRLYILKFDRREWVYRVTCEGEFVVNFNTKKLTEAKKWLHDHLCGQ